MEESIKEKEDIINKDYILSYSYFPKNDICIFDDDICTFCDISIYKIGIMHDN